MMFHGQSMDAIQYIYTSVRLLVSNKATCSPQTRARGAEGGGGTAVILPPLKYKSIYRGIIRSTGAASIDLVPTPAIATGVDHAQCDMPSYSTPQVQAINDTDTGSGDTGRGGWLDTAM